MGKFVQYAQLRDVNILCALTPSFRDRGDYFMSIVISYLGVSFGRCKHIQTIDRKSNFVSRYDKILDISITKMAERVPIQIKDIYYFQKNWPFQN